MLNNTAYAADALKNGNFAATAFTESDWFKLTITGLDSLGQETGAVDFLLADGTDIVENWQTVDLTSLGTPTQITFTLGSSDTGAYGINTPTYAAIDNIELTQSVPEPSTAILMLLGLLVLPSISRRKK